MSNNRHINFNIYESHKILKYLTTNCQVRQKIKVVSNWTNSYVISFLKKHN